MTDPQSTPIVLTDDDRAALLDAATFLEVRATRAFLRHNAVALLRKLAKTAAPSPSEADAILRELVASSEAIDASLENFTDDDYEVANTRHHAAWTRARTYCEAAAPQAGWMPIETAPKDGTWIVIAYRDGVAVAQWLEYPGNPVEGPDGTVWMMGWMFREDYAHLCPGMEDGFLGWNEDPMPTLWMPLPPAPTETP